MPSPTPPNAHTLNTTDQEMLYALSLKGYRFLTTYHLSMLLFASDDECTSRMKQLCHIGLVSTMFLPTLGGDQQVTVYTLARPGAVLLARLKGISPAGLASIRRASYLFLEHGLRVSDFMCSLEAALRKEGSRLLYWRSERQLKAPGGRPLRVPDPFQRDERIPIIPDGLFSLKTDRQLEHFFIEADRGTMSLHAMRKKMLGYIQLYRGGLHQKCFNIPHFRVLMITTTPYRRDKLRQILREIGYCPNMGWFAIWSDIKAEKMFTPIWLKCSDQEYYSIMK